MGNPVTPSELREIQLNLVKASEIQWVPVNPSETLALWNAWALAGRVWLEYWWQLGEFTGHTTLSLIHCPTTRYWLGQPGPASFAHTQILCLSQNPTCLTQRARIGRILCAFYLRSFGSNMKCLEKVFDSNDVQLTQIENREQRKE